MNKNIAVIGCGYWGKNLVRNFAELGALHTICDTDFGKLEEWRSGGVNTDTDHGHRYGSPKLTTDFEKVLLNDDIKGVVLSTGAESHYLMTKRALLAGKDVFVEKPLALNTAEGRELVQLAEEKNRILMVGHLLEYHPGIIKLKELIDTGQLGKINYIYSNRLNLGKFRTEENILWSFAPHDISVVLLLLGESPQVISAHGGSYLHQEIADVTITTMSFASGVQSHIFVSWLHPYKEQKLIVVGDRKMALFDDVSEKDKLLLYSHKIDWIGRVPVPRKEHAEVVEFEMTEPLRTECQHFLDCMASRQKPKTDGENGLRVLKVLERCQESLEQSGKLLTISGSRFTIHSPQFFAHETACLDEPCEIGEGTKIWHFSHIMKNTKIGKNCNIGQNVVISEGVTIGNNVKIQNNVSIYEGVTLEDDVFCGPSMVFTNILTPRSEVPRNTKEHFLPILAKKGATIGANATIICGNTIGRYALIGAGAIVTKNVPDYAIVTGNPARVKGWACECGLKLNFVNSVAVCSNCNKQYRKKGLTLRKIS